MDHRHTCPSGGDQTISTSPQESLRKAAELLAAEHIAPTSIVRPAIRPGRMMLRNLLWLLLSAAFCFAVGLPDVTARHRPALTVLFVLVVSVINARRIIIDLVLLYQRYAPLSLRAACVYQPSCSQYMILAVEKYGPFRGVVKGIGRLLRCHPPHGGEDYP